ncbi:MAG: tripartite tricarboxylate transporter permease [Candidatus Binatia bacterium]
MDALGNLLLGFSVALTPINLFWCFVGVVLGTVVGMLPGLGPAATIAMLLPLTLKMDHTTAIIALAGIFYEARYGGSTTSILLNIPGESSSVVTCLDGYQMAHQGRAGAALGISAIASFVAGTVGVLGLMLIAPPLARLALRFAPPEYFALMVLGLAMVVFLAGESMVKALLAMLMGLWLATIGTDLFTAESRFTFGQVKLLGGVDFIAATVGIFAIGEVLINLESQGGAEIFKLSKGLRNLCRRCKISRTAASLF